MNYNALFLRLLYAQVILGIISYGVAERSPAMVLATGALAVLSWYVVEGPSGRHAPHWLINVGVLIATGWTIWLQVRGEPLVLALGQYILYLQLFKLYDRKANRDYAQLMVLSLMQMICGAIISAEIIFAILLVAYLVIAMITAMAYQLKLGYDEVSTQNMKHAPAGSELVRPRSVSSGRHERHFRNLSVSCAAAITVLSIIFFLLMPRGRFSEALGQWNAAANPTTGFASQVQLTSGRQIAVSRVPVMNVRLLKDGRNIGAEERIFRLRGMPLDSYHQGEHRWMRGRRLYYQEHRVAYDDLSIAALLPPAGREVIRQEITLRGNTDGVLFSLYAPSAIQVATRNETRFNPIDQALFAERRRGASLEYAVESVVDFRGNEAERYPQLYPRVETAGDSTFNWETYARRPVVSSPRLTTLVEELMQQRGLRRDRTADTDPADARIAAAFEEYLRQACTYTLDLPAVEAGKDPITAFLFDHKRGHCEYFASALAAMLREVGIRARVISGFVAAEFNAVGGYYVVRELNAHAWVEAWTAERGWITLDASPPAALEGIHHARRGMLSKMRDIYDFVEFHWISNVITYDESQRQGIVGVVKSALTEAYTNFVQIMADAKELIVSFFQDLSLLARIAAVAGLLGVVWGVSRLHRGWRKKAAMRAVRRRTQVGETVQVEFYNQMMSLLAAAGYRKASWQTPFAFAAEIAGDDREGLGVVVPLTQAFYAVRFGGREMDAAAQARVDEHLLTLRSALAEVRRAPTR